jgi:hypothetical protein
MDAGTIPSSGPEVSAARRRFRLWLALAIALVPAVAAHLAYAWSIRDGWVQACNPYWDGCTSISRAARHGDGNTLFKLIMLPVAVVSAVLWREAWEWLRRRNRAPGPALRASGAVAAVALATYVAFLGDAGEFAQWLRRYGALAYFAATYLAQIGFVRHAWHLGDRGAPLQAMFALCVLLLVFGLVSVWATGTLDDPMKDQVENAIEWNLGVFFTAWFLSLAWLWGRERPGLPRAVG